MEATLESSVLQREDVEFLSQGTRCAAWLYRPARDNPPLIVMANGLAIRQMRMAAYAERFQAAGFAVLVFEYRYFGDSDGEPRQLLGLKAQRDDFRAALAYARTLPGVDHQRIAVWGTSMSGSHVLQVAARDHGIAALVAQCPFTDWSASLRSLGLLNALLSGYLGILDLIAKLLRRGPVLLPLGVFAAPFWPAMMNDPEVNGGSIEIMPPGSEFSGRLSRLYRRYGEGRIDLPEGIKLTDRPETVPGTRFVGTVYTPGGGVMPNGVSARFGLTVGFDRPSSAMSKITCPALICVCDRDTAAPPGPTTKAATKAGFEVRHYDANHFGIYVGDKFEQAVGDQIEFLQRQLG